MKYIKYLNRFWQRYDELRGTKQAIGAGSVQLYTRLVHEFNAAGLREAWPEVLHFKDVDLAKRLDASVNTLTVARKQLVNEGLIGYESPGPGSRLGAAYRLPTSSKIDEVEAVPEPENIPATSSNSDEVEAPTSSKIDEVTYSKFDEVRGLTYAKFDEVGGVTYSKFDEVSIYIRDNKKETSILSKETGSVSEKQQGAAGEKPVLASPKNGAAKSPTPLPPAPPVRRGDPFTRGGESERCNVPFSTWFATYDKRILEAGCRIAWVGLTDAERELAMAHTPGYVASTKNKAFRADPINYLNLKKFNDEIIISHVPATDAPARPGAHSRAAQNFRDAQSSREPSTDFGEL